jgi:hypothetical protein
VAPHTVSSPSILAPVVTASVRVPRNRRSGVVVDGEMVPRADVVVPLADAGVDARGADDRVDLGPRVGDPDGAAPEAERAADRHESEDRAGREADGGAGRVERVGADERRCHGSPVDGRSS